MNIENLKRAAELVAKIPQKNFDMETYRKGFDGDDDYSKFTAVCGTVGCIIGHCTALDTTESLDNFFNKYDKNYCMWSEHFFNIEVFSDAWLYLFGPNWANDKETNTPEHAVYRINRVIDGFIPSYEDYPEDECDDDCYCSDY